MQRGRLGRRYLQHYSAKRHNDGSSNADNFWYKPLISLMNFIFPSLFVSYYTLPIILANKNINANAFTQATATLRSA